jgi:hypothetical protein
MLINDIGKRYNTDGVGYEIKDGSGNKGDRKENFDVTTGSVAWLEKNIDEIKNPTALEFVKKATALVGLLKPSILEFAGESEKAFGLKDFEKEVEASESTFFVRFIHYFGDREINEEIASSHTDRSGFTFHLFESHEGFQCMNHDKKWINIPITEGERFIIPEKVGGRFSVFSAVGLLPLSLAGIDIATILKRVQVYTADLFTPDLNSNPSLISALFAYSQHQEGRPTYDHFFFRSFQQPLACLCCGITAICVRGMIYRCFCPFLW